MNSFAKFRDSIVGNIIILALICFIVTLALAGTYKVTQTALEEQKAIAAAEAEEAGEGADSGLSAALPGGSDFVEVDGALPEGVLKAYSAEGAGYVFEVQSKGFGGAATFTIGIDSDGKIAGIVPGENGETEGIGSAALEADYLAEYVGKSSSGEVDAKTGATVTSGAIHDAIDLSFEAYGQLA